MARYHPRRAHHHRRSQQDPRRSRQTIGAAQFRRFFCSRWACVYQPCLHARGEQRELARGTTLRIDEPHRYGAAQASLMLLGYRCTAALLVLALLALLHECTVMCLPPEVKTLSQTKEESVHQFGQNPQHEQSANGGHGGSVVPLCPSLHLLLVSVCPVQSGADPAVRRHPLRYPADFHCT